MSYCPFKVSQNGYSTECKGASCAVWDDKLEQCLFKTALKTYIKANEIIKHPFKSTLSAQDIEAALEEIQYYRVPDFGEGIPF